MRSWSEGRRVSSVRAAVLVARATCVEAIRLRIAWFIAAITLLLVGVAVWLRDLQFGAAEIRFLFDLGYGAIGVATGLVAVLGTAQLHFSAIDSRLAAFALSRPVDRGAWLVGQFAGFLAVLAWFAGALGCVTAGLIAWRAGDAGFAISWAPVFAGAALLWLKAAIAAAATLFVCTYARSGSFASGAGLLFLLVGHLRPLAAEFPVEMSVRGFFGAAFRAWPDLTLFDPSNEGLLPGLAVLAYGAGYVLVFQAAAVLSFHRREL